VFGGQIRGPRGQTRPAVDVHWFRESLMLGTLDHDLLADIAKRIGDRARWYVAAEHVAHVLPGRSVSCDVSKVPKRYRSFDRALKIESSLGSRACSSVSRSIARQAAFRLTFRC
jgi:hypothetical protein